MPLRIQGIFSGITLPWWPTSWANQLESFRNIEPVKDTQDNGPLRHKVEQNTVAGTGTGTNEGVTRKKKRCCSYKFDSKKCRTVGGRILCGYNNNVGEIADSGEAEEYPGEDCRVRKGRIECGYFEPPFRNLRRPPAMPSDYRTLRRGSDDYDIVTIRVPRNSQAQLPYYARSIQVKKDQAKRAFDKPLAQAGKADVVANQSKADVENPAKPIGVGKQGDFGSMSMLRSKPEEIKCLEIKDRIVCVD